MSNKKFVQIVLLILIIFISSLLLSLNMAVRDKQIDLIHQKLIQEAKAHFDNMVDTRAWNTISKNPWQQV